MVSQSLLASIGTVTLTSAVVANGFVVGPPTASSWTRPTTTPTVSTALPSSSSSWMHSNNDGENARQTIELLFDKANLHTLMDFEDYLDAPSVEEAENAHGMPWIDTIGKSELDDPLLYMPFWEWQMEFMKSNLFNLRVAPKEITEEHSFQQNTEKKARIVSNCFQSDEYRKIRMTYYDAGDNTQVFNSVFYPRPEYNLPVLGIDLLAFNRKKYLAIVDFQPLYEEGEDGHETKFEHLLQPIRNKYESLQGKMSSKFYDETQFFSKQMLFARFEESEVVMRDLLPAFQGYVETHLNLFKQTMPKVSQVPKIVERQKAYDTYSAQRDPATGLFAAMFGSEWADTFVYDFLFSTSERPSEEELEALKEQRKAAGGGGGNPFANGGAPKPPQTAAPQNQHHQPQPVETSKPEITMDSSKTSYDARVQAMKEV